MTLMANTLMALQARPCGPLMALQTLMALQARHAVTCTLLASSSHGTISLACLRLMVYFTIIITISKRQTLIGCKPKRKSYTIHIKYLKITIIQASKDSLLLHIVPIQWLRMLPNGYVCYLMVTYVT